MVEIVDINDQESLRRWLEETGQPQHACTVLAYRSLMRTLTAHWRLDPQFKQEDSCLASRAILIAGVSVAFPCVRFRAKAMSASAATYPDAAYAAYAAVGKVYTEPTANAMLVTVGAYAAVAAGTVEVDAARNAIDAAAVAMWAEIRHDCERLGEWPELLHQPLFQKRPDWHRGLWSEVRAKNRYQQGYDFWIEWYEKSLDGEPQDWDLLRLVATQNKPFWQGGDDKINARIAALVGEYKASLPKRKQAADARANSPHGEDIVLGRDRLLDARPKKSRPRTFFANAKKRAVFAIGELSKPDDLSNVAHALKPELVRLSAILEEHAKWPLGIYEGLIQAIRNIDMKVKDGSLPNGDARVDALRTQLENSAFDILQHDQHTQETVKFRGSMKFEAMSEAEQDLYSALMEYLAENSQPPLAGEFRHDAATATDPNADPENQKDARYRSGSRAIRGGDYRDKLTTGAAVAKDIKAIWDAVDTIILKWFT